MTDREIMDLAEVICDAGYDWNGYIENCHEKGESPYLLYDEFLAQYILESGYRKEREERARGCEVCDPNPKAVWYRFKDKNVLCSFCPVCGKPLKGADEC